MKSSCFGPIAARWQVGSALLLFVVAGQAFGSPAISGKVTATLPAGTMLSDLKAVVVATNDKNEVFTANPSDTDGTYSIAPVNNGTYKVVDEKTLEVTITFMGKTMTDKSQFKVSKDTLELTGKDGKSQKFNRTK